MKNHFSIVVLSSLFKGHSMQQSQKSSKQQLMHEQPMLVKLFFLAFIISSKIFLILLYFILLPFQTNKLYLIYIITKGLSIDFVKFFWNFCYSSVNKIYSFVYLFKYFFYFTRLSNSSKLSFISFFITFPPKEKMIPKDD